MVELNCETDFVAKDVSFRAFGDKVAEIALAGKISDLEVLKEADFGAGESVQVTLNNLIAKIGENMNLRRVIIIEGENLGTYVSYNFV